MKTVMNQGERRLKMHMKKGLVTLLLLILTVSFFLFDPALGEASAAVDPYHPILEACIVHTITADLNVIETAVALTACSALYEALYVLSYTYPWI